MEGADLVSLLMSPDLVQQSGEDNRVDLRLSRPAENRESLASIALFHRTRKLAGMCRKCSTTSSAFVFGWEALVPGCSSIVRRNHHGQGTDSRHLSSHPGHMVEGADVCVGGLAHRLSHLGLSGAPAKLSLSHLSDALQSQTDRIETFRHAWVAELFFPLVEVLVPISCSFRLGLADSEVLPCDESIGSAAPELPQGHG